MGKGTNFSGQPVLSQLIKLANKIDGQAKN